MLELSETAQKARQTMTNLQKKLRAAVAVPKELYNYPWQDAAEWENARLAPILAALEGCVEALEMGAFHHPICPYYDSKPCLCAHKKVNAALESLRKVLDEK